jgi:hypothetical protein
MAGSNVGKMLPTWLFAVVIIPHGYVSVNGPHCDGASRPHLGRFDDGVTEVIGPTCDTPGVV